MAQKKDIFTIEMTEQSLRLAHVRMDKEQYVIAEAQNFIVLLFVD